MHWATSQRKVPSLPEPETNIPLEGDDDEHSVTKKLKSDSEASSSTTGSGTHVQDSHRTASKSSLLEEFRKGMTYTYMYM